MSLNPRRWIVTGDSRPLILRELQAMIEICRLLEALPAESRLYVMDTLTPRIEAHEKRAKDGEERDEAGLPEREPVIVGEPLPKRSEKRTA